MIKSPLRYPGGKSRAVARILERLPKTITEFREPFVGGGSVFLAVRQQHPEARVWINDANADLMAFWWTVRDDAEQLVKLLHTIHRIGLQKGGRWLYEDYRHSNPDDSTFNCALRFFLLNRITFSGLADSGGYSPSAFETRFTPSSIERIAAIAPLLQGVILTCGDYAHMLGSSGAVVFLDPPYKAQERSKLYGKNGDLHTGFQHAELADQLRCTEHDWLMTYDDSPEIQALYGSWAQLEPWELQYGMNNSSGQAAKGEELFISRRETA